MKKTIGIFAHVDAGKTTLSEAILHYTGTIRTRGRIEDQNTVMDTAPVEKRRGITCFSGGASFMLGQDKYYLIDTPGHADFLPDTERCMAALDAAVVVVSAVDGVESNTEMIWDMLNARKVPTLFFINKCDRDIADPAGVLGEIRKVFSSHAHIYETEEYIEAVAASSDELMEQFFEGGCDPHAIAEQGAVLFGSRRLFPCVCGSALSGQGVDTLLNVLDLILRTDYRDDMPLCAEIFKVIRKKDQRFIVCHIRGGQISVRDTLPNGEQITAMYGYDGARSLPVPTASAGDVVMICGVHGYRAGDCIGKDAVPPGLPGLCARVLFPLEYSADSVLEKLRILEDEEPTLSVTYQVQTGEISVSVMGTIQLEILTDEFERRFGFGISFDKPGVLYKETLLEPTVGYGHYEPLRHYSEVHLRLEPNPRGSGITFDSQCSLDVLTSNYQNLVRTHVFEKIHRGVLIGAPLDDVKITLLTGASHEKHTEGGDFRQSTYRAVRHGLMRGQCCLLEPWYHCRFTLSTHDSGRLISDIGGMCGVLISVENLGERTVVCARVPISEFAGYQGTYTSYTCGRGRVSFYHDGYDLCHDADAVIERTGYNPVADLDNTPDSVFCAHGAGFLVPWGEVEKYIHCK